MPQGTVRVQRLCLQTSGVLLKCSGWGEGAKGREGAVNSTEPLEGSERGVPRLITDSGPDAARQDRRSKGGNRTSAGILA